MKLLRMLLLSGLALAARADMENDPMPFILRGIEKFAMPPYSDTFCAYGNEMLPVLAAGPLTQQYAVVVAGEFGQGRFMAFGNKAFLDGSLTNGTENGQLVESSLWWASHHKVGKMKAGFVGVLNLPDTVTDFLQAEGFSAQQTTLKDMAGLQTIIGDISDLKDDEVQLLRDFANGGGGLVVSADATRWVKMHPDRNITLDYPPNKLFGPRGCIWNGVEVLPDVTPGKPVPATPLLHGRDALNVAIRIADGRVKPPDEQRRLVSHTINRAFYYAPPEDQYFLPDLHSAIKVASLRAFPTRETPIVIGEVLPRLFVADMNKKFLTKPVDQLQPHPSAFNFPGYVDSDATRQKIVIKLDPAERGLQSCGWYAPPAEVVSVEVPTQYLNLKIRVRVGAHSDKLWEEEAWTRYPEVYREYDLPAQSNQIGIAFGGPIYFIVPPEAMIGSTPTNPAKPIPVRLTGAIQAPYFSMGRTSGDFWNEVGSRAPATWAELGGANVVLSLPSKTVRGIGRVAQFVSAWDGYVFTQRQLAGVTNREFAERVVVDIQPRRGKAHTGYPVVLPFERAGDLVNLRGFVDGTLFDVFGLLAQNMLPGAIVFDGGETMLGNLISVYAAEQYLKKPPEVFNLDLGGVNRTNRLAAYFNQGAKFDVMKADPMYGTIMLTEIASELGWPAFAKTFAMAHALPPKSYPVSDDMRRDLFVILLSQNAGKNLVPFFRKWGVPVSDAAAAKVTSLPEWMSKELAVIPTEIKPVPENQRPKPTAPAAPVVEPEKTGAGPAVSPL